MMMSTSAETLIFKIISEKEEKESKHLGFPSFITKFVCISANCVISHVPCLSFLMRKQRGLD